MKIAKTFKSLKKTIIKKNQMIAAVIRYKIGSHKVNYQNKTKNQNNK